MMYSMRTLSMQHFLAQPMESHSAEPDYLDEEVYLSAESIIRPEVIVQYVCKTTDRAAR